MSSLRTVLSYTAIAAVLGVGFGMWSVMAPEEERRKDLAKKMHESNPMEMEEMKKRNTLVMQVLKDAAESKDNMAREWGGPVK